MNRARLLVRPGIFEPRALVPPAFARALRAARPVAFAALAALAVGGCGVSHADFDAKAHEAEVAKQQADSTAKQLAQVQQQLTGDEQQIAQLKTALGMAESQVVTDEQKAQLEEAARAMKEAQERGKLLEDLQAKLKKTIDAGHVKVTTRRGRVVLQLHNDVLFDAGDAEIKVAGKQAVAEVAATLRALGGRRFQVAGHTDSQALTPETKKKFATNWELSAARAIAVVKLLVQDGVDPGSLSAAGYGPYDAIAANGSADGLAKNRRIEITLVPNVAGLVVADKDKDKK